MGRQSLPTYMRPLPSKALVIEEGPKSRWPGATYSMQHKVVRSFMRFPQLTILIYQVEGLVSIHTCWYHSICQYVFLFSVHCSALRQCGGFCNICNSPLACSICSCIFLRLQLTSPQARVRKISRTFKMLCRSSTASLAW